MITQFKPNINWQLKFFDKSFSINTNAFTAQRTHLHTACNRNISCGMLSKRYFLGILYFIARFFHYLQLTSWHVIRSLQKSWFLEAIVDRLSDLVFSILSYMHMTGEMSLKLTQWFTAVLPIQNQL